MEVEIVKSTHTSKSGHESRSQRQVGGQRRSRCEARREGGNRQQCQIDAGDKEISCRQEISRRSAAGDRQEISCRQEISRRSAAGDRQEISCRQEIGRRSAAGRQLMHCRWSALPTLPRQSVPHENTAERESIACRERIDSVCACQMCSSRICAAGRVAAFSYWRLLLRRNLHSGACRCFRLLAVTPAARSARRGEFRV